MQRLLCYGSGKDRSGLQQGSGTDGRVVQGATPAVAVGGGRRWELRETSAASLGEGEGEVTIWPTPSHVFIGLI